MSAPSGPLSSPRRAARGPGAASASGLPVASAGLSARRQVLASAVLLTTLPTITAALLAHRDRLSYATPVLLVLVVVVVVALLGGLRVALPAALLGGLALNWFFTPPYNTLRVERSDQLLALVVYLSFAVAVAAIVDLAARRTAEATRARAEAEALSSLAGATLAESQTLPDLMERVRATFGMRQVDLLEHTSGQWTATATVHQGLPGSDEIELRVPAGTDLELRAYGPALFAEDRRVLTAFAEATGTALRGRRLAEQAQAHAGLQAADRMRTALLAAVGHDLRTPLASIKAAVSSLRQSDIAFSDADRDELLETIESSADRLQALVANLLDASRLQAGAVSVHLQAVGLAEVTGTVLLTLADSDRARVVLDVADDLPDALADPGLLERVLANLLDNALRHAPDGSAVTLRGDVQHEHVVCEVIDHGPGIAPGHHDQLFAPFQRLGDRTPGGIGLGLAVARGFVQAMHGDLAPCETDGGGLTMRVLLPVARHSGPALPPPRQPLRP